jgi:hypothetical protein
MSKKHTLFKANELDFPLRMLFALRIVVHPNNIILVIQEIRRKFTNEPTEITKVPLLKLVRAS